MKYGSCFWLSNFNCYKMKLPDSNNQNTDENAKCELTLYKNSISIMKTCSFCEVY